MRGCQSVRTINHGRRITAASGSGFAQRSQPIKKRLDGIVNLDGRGMLVVSVARRLGSEGPLLAYFADPALTERGRKKAPWVR